MRNVIKTFGSATCLAAVLVMSASHAQSQNILVDPGSESGLTQPSPIPLPGGVGGDWAVFNGATVSTAYPESGSYSLQSVQGAGQAWNFAAAYQLLPIAGPGVAYTLSADYATTTGLGSYAGAFIQITYFDGAGVDLGTVETSPGLANALNFNPAANNTWYNASVSATAPAGAVYVAPYLAFMMDGSQTGDVDLYWDNGTLMLVPEPTTFALTGLGAAALLIFRRRS